MWIIMTYVEEAGVFTGREDLESGTSMRAGHGR